MYLRIKDPSLCINSKTIGSAVHIWKKDIRIDFELGFFQWDRRMDLEITYLGKFLRLKKIKDNDMSGPNIVQTLNEWFKSAKLAYLERGY